LISFACDLVGTTADLSIRLRWGNGMFGIRAALMALCFALLSSTSALFARSGESPAKDCVFAAVRVNSPTAGTVGFGLSRSSTLARFSPWKARPKIVLVEAYEAYREETDLGPAVVPNGVSSLSSIAIIAPRVPTASPLRC
jgi:hypothetical protein